MIRSTGFSYQDIPSAHERNVNRSLQTLASSSEPGRLLNDIGDTSSVARNLLRDIGDTHLDPDTQDVTSVTRLLNSEACRTTSTTRYLNPVKHCATSGTRF